MGYKYTEKDAARETNSSNKDAKSAWHDARDDAAKEGGWNVPSDRHGDGDGGGCFIATAAYGSYFEPKVEVFKNFRDVFLVKSLMGRIFIRSYYKISSVISRIVLNYEFLKKATRLVLNPLAFIIKYIFL